MAWTADSVLIRVVSFILSVLYREVLLYPYWRDVTSRPTLGNTVQVKRVIAAHELGPWSACIQVKLAELLAEGVPNGRGLHCVLKKRGMIR